MKFKILPLLLLMVSCAADSRDVISKDLNINRLKYVGGSHSC